MTKKITKTDMKVGSTKHRKGIPLIKHGVPQPGITKKEFMDVLAKAAPLVEHEAESDSEKPET